MKPEEEQQVRAIAGLNAFMEVNPFWDKGLSLRYDQILVLFGVAFQVVYLFTPEKLPWQAFLFIITMQLVLIIKSLASLRRDKQLWNEFEKRTDEIHEEIIDRRFNR